MTPHEAFVRAIVGDPDDDTVRLVYADWLEERGDPSRAEFVRVQVECDGKSRWHPLRSREQELLRENVVRWLGPWKRHLRRWVFRRGFLDHVRCDAAHFLDAAEVLAHEPVGTARLERVTGVIGRLAASPLLGRVCRLDLSHNFLGDTGAEVLAASAGLGGLRQLRLGHNFLGRRAAEALAGSPHLGPRCVLDLGATRSTRRRGRYWRGGSGGG